MPLPNVEHDNQPCIIDEIQHYVDSRYVGASEAVWRIMCFPMADKYPPVQCLQLHEENYQQVLFEEGEELEALIRAGTKQTTLTGYFAAVSNEFYNPLSPAELGIDTTTQLVYPQATNLTYQDFPTFYTWNANKKKWSRRKKPRKSDTIGRIYNAHPNSGERFFLQMLLCKVPGATSFKHLRTVDSVEHATFKSACVALGLLADDSEWKACLIEAASHLGPKALRQLFAHIIFHNHPTDPLQLWELQLEDGSFLKHLMSEDFRLSRAHQQQHAVPFDDSDSHQCLHFLQDEFLSMSNGGSNLHTFGLPLPTTPKHDLPNNTDFFEFNVTEQDIVWRNAYRQFNDQQRAAFDQIDNAVHNKQPSIFFLNAVGGTGKTFLFSALLAKWRSSRKIVHAVASTGIAALLLPGAVTAHSKFRVPIEILPHSSCSLDARSTQGKSLIASEAILWDEAPMSGKDVVECVERLLRDLTGNRNLLFGGKIFVFGGDFRQTLPVIGRQGRAGTVSKTIQRCSFWSKVRVLNLTINERVKRNVDNDEGRRFADFLIQLGEGRLKLYPELGDNIIKLPDEHIFHNDSLEDFVRWCYPDIENSSSTINVASKAILAPKNEHVDRVNELCVSLMQGALHIFESGDSVKSCSSNAEVGLFPVEYLNTITASGLPPHKLAIKVGAPVILLRNLNQKRGLCNGTRLVVKQVLDRLLKVAVMNGTHSGTETWIPRIDHVTAENFLPFTMNRRQFPIKLAFAMSINKSQGQSLNFTGLWLPEPVFAHGQLYAALSRSGIPSNTKVLIQDVRGKQGKFPFMEGTFTKNIVYQEVL